MGALDMDVGELLKKLVSGGKKNKADAKSSGADKGAVGTAESNARRIPANLIWGALGGVFVLSLIAFFALYYWPQHQRMQAMQVKSERLSGLKLEVSQSETALIKAKARLAAASQRYDELTRLFHTEQELEDLYRQISTMALSDGLTITNIRRQPERPVYETKASAKPLKKGESAPVAYFRIPMDVEFSGAYPSYLRFRASLADIPKLVNIDQETIQVVSGDGGGVGVTIKATISTYRMPERYMQKDEKK